MTLPTSGTISFEDINVELGRAADTSMSLDDADVRALAGISSGTISLEDFYGKSAGHTLSVGNFSHQGGVEYGFRNFFGSISPTTVDTPFGTGTISQFYVLDSSTQGADQCVLSLNGLTNPTGSMIVEYDSDKTQTLNHSLNGGFSAVASSDLVTYLSNNNGSDVVVKFVF